MPTRACGRARSRGGVKSTLVHPPIGLHAHLLEDKKVKVTRTFAAAPDLFNGDLDQMEQAFNNLFFNALDAMQPNGHLTVSTEILPAGSVVAGFSARKNQSLLRLTIQDDGVGIPPENLDRIFNHGFTTRKDGHGFGLHSGALAAKELGGALDVRSEGVGKGAMC